MLKRTLPGILAAAAPITYLNTHRNKQEENFFAKNRRIQPKAAFALNPFRHEDKSKNEGETIASESSSGKSDENDASTQTESIVIHKNPKNHSFEPSSNHIINTAQAAQNSLTTLSLQLESNLKLQIFKYNDLIVLDKKLSEYHINEANAASLNAMTKEEVEVTIMNQRMDLGELMIDYNEKVLLYENAVKLYKETSQMTFNSDFVSLAVIMGTTLDYWKGIIERLVRERNESYLAYVKSHAEIIENTNLEWLGGEEEANEKEEKKEGEKEENDQNDQKS